MAKHRKEVKKGLIVFGSLIMLGTFIAKEVLADGLKDVASGVETALNFFDNQEITTSANSKPIPDSPDGLSLSEISDHIELMRERTLTILRSVTNLARVLSDGYPAGSLDEAGKISGQLNGISRKIGGLHGDAPDGLAKAKALYKQAQDSHEQAENLRLTVVLTARKVAEQRKAEYGAAKWAAIVLSFSGWLLNMYGLVSGKQINVAEV